MGHEGLREELLADIAGSCWRPAQERLRWDPVPEPFPDEDPVCEDDRVVLQRPLDPYVTRDQLLDDMYGHGIPETPDLNRE